MKLRFIAAIAVVTLLVLLVQDVPLAFYMHQNEQNKITGTLQRDALVLAGDDHHNPAWFVVLNFN